MPRIHQQTKTFFAPLRYIVAAGLSVAFATSAFAQVTQPKQAEPTRSEVTPRERKNEKIDAKACVDADIERYVLDLGTLKMTNKEFQALVRCDASAVPALSQALNSDHSSEVRASAAYVLGQIGSEAHMAVPKLTEVLQEGDDVIVVAASLYALGRIGKRATGAVPQIIEVYKDRELGLAVHLQAAQALKAIETTESLSALSIPTRHEFCLDDPDNPFGRLGCSVDPTAVRKHVNARSPLICLLQGIKSIFPRCR